MRRAFFFLCLCWAQGCSPDKAAPVVEDRWLRLSDGDSLHYAITGAGADTIVVLGGGPAWPSGYLHQPLGELARDYGMVFLDLRGRGLSSPITDSLAASLDNDLEDLAGAQSALGLGPVTLAGHGYGAGLAAMYALRHPELVNQLVLVSPMFTTVNLVWQGSFQPNDSVATARYLAARRLGRETVDVTGFCREFWGFDLSPVEETDSATIDLAAGDICDATPSNLRGMGTVSRAIRRSLGSWDWRDSLARIQAPALILQGDGNLFLLRTAQTWAELLPHASFIAVSGSAHFPWAGTAGQFERSVRAFLSNPRAVAIHPPVPERDKAVTPVQR